MSKYKYVILSILTFILLPNSIKGAVCADSEKVKYQSLAKNISVSYDYTEENTKAKFNVVFSNVPEGFYIKEYNSNKTYERTGSEMVISNLNQGKSFKFEIYTTSLGCDDVALYTHYVNLPYYNPYYNDSLCSGIENYKYCNKWINKRITRDEFEKNVTKYKESLNKKDEIIEEKPEGLFDIIAKIYLKYYWIILPIIIVTGFISIKRYQRKQDLF